MGERDKMIKKKKVEFVFYCDLEIKHDGEPLITASFVVIFQVWQGMQMPS